MKRSGLQPAMAVGVAFLLLQLALVVRARFVDERFFCWAPFDEATRFETQVVIGGRTLSREETNRRYRHGSAGWENHSVHNVLRMIRQYESTYGRSDQAQVTVTYSINGHPSRIWTWPPLP